jgi:two-component system sensor histidine kinase VicK
MGSWATAQSRHAKRTFYRTLYPGINARVTGPFLLVVAIIAGIGVFIVTRLVAGSLQERFNNQLVDSARAASSSIVDVERQQLAALRLMAFTEGVPQAIAAGDVNSLDLWLRPIAANARVDDVIVFDASGRGLLQLSRTDSASLDYSSPPPPDLTLWSGVQQVLGSTTDALGDKWIDIIGTTPQTTFYVTAPVRGSDNRVVGGITLGIRTNRLAQQVSAQSLSAVALYNAEGQVMGSTFRSVPFEALALNPEGAREMAELAQTTSPVEKLDLNGEPYQLLYASLKLRSQEVGLLAVGLPTNYIVERISTSRDTFGVLFSVLFLTVSVLGLLTGRTITRPVRQLVDTTRAIRQGDFSKRVGLRTPDELGELGVSFDHMTDQLVARNREVEALYLQQLEETAQREAVLASIGDAVIVQDPAGTIILRNLSAQRLIENTLRNPAAQRDFSRLCRNPEALASPRTVELEGCYFSVAATPVRLSSGKVLGHVIVFHDISPLVEAERMKDELIMQMSHELRTPLTAARGYADLLKNLDGQRLSDQGDEFLRKTVDHLAVLERMVNQVIDVSAIISNRFAIDATRFNLGKLLRECVTAWEARAAERELELALTISSDDLWIEGDRYHLGQVFHHLLRNAVSYTLPGGTVEMCTAIRDGHATVYVIDNGVGITPDELGRVFERMYRGKSAEAGPTDSRGLGLGLYLSKHIVEAHRGAIQIESKLNYGTVVTVELPVRQDGQG